MTNARRPNARGQGDLLRAEIVAAAVRMLGELADDEALSLRAVARELAISPTSVYLYFPDRDALVLAAMQHCHDDLVRAVADAEAGHAGDPAARLLARLLALAAWARANPGLYKVMHESRVSRDPGMPFKERVLAGTTAMVQECMDAGVAPAGDALTVALDLRAAVLGALSLRINEPALPWPPVAEQIVRLVTRLAGLAGQPGERNSATIGAGADDRG